MMKSKQSLFLAQKKILKEAGCEDYNESTKLFALNILNWSVTTAGIFIVFYIFITVYGVLGKAPVFLRV